VTLTTDTVKRFKGKSKMVAFDADGGSHEFFPECHVSRHV
jgi:hypothetical protein